MSETAIARKSNIISKVRYWLNAPNRAMIAAYAAIVTGMASVSPTLCSSNTNYMKKLFGQMVTIICDIAFYVGAIIIVGGIFNWVLAQKDENADGQSRAIKFIVCGFALTSLKVIVKPLMTSLGLSVG